MCGQYSSPAGQRAGGVTGHLNNHGAIIPLAFQKRYCIQFCKQKSLDVDIAALIDVAFAVFIVLWVIGLHWCLRRTPFFIVAAAAQGPSCTFLCS